MYISDYFLKVYKLINDFTLTANYNIETDIRSSKIGFIKIALFLRNESVLYIREFISIYGNEIDRLMYVYQYLDKSGNLIFRYDNTEHFPQLNNYPHHKHLNNGNVIESNAPLLEDVLFEIEMNFETI